MSYHNFWFKKDIDVKVLDSHIQRRVVAHSNNIMIVEVEFKKNGVGQLHKHIHEQATYVVSGKFEFEIGGVKKIIEQGDSIYLEPNVLHGCVCLEDGMLLDTFTPQREDFIEKEK